MGKQKRKTKMLSFTEKDFEVHDFLMELSNASEYVIDLIRRDMSEKNTDDKYERIIKELNEIKGILKSGKFKVESTTNTTSIDDNLKNKMKQALSIFIDDDE
ncbi:hypothetical protein [Turicibacter sanguinis]|uniref:hypothetical protein n=1 Tax=Turicibacter sanguinis TaxID=154288 RepID=UPI0018A8C851|nr:hypothetical protein [Turicibacter sanguinis]MDB8552141.1 hypothetical protein [Turicibacter sanguinis]